jgi:hypothetical protein
VIITDHYATSLAESCQLSARYDRYNRSARYPWSKTLKLLSSSGKSHLKVQLILQKRSSIWRLIKTEEINMKKHTILLATGFLTAFIAFAQNGSADNRTGFSREEIRAMPIAERPQRIGHFYGRFYRYFNAGKPLMPGPGLNPEPRARSGFAAPNSTKISAEPLSK